MKPPHVSSSGIHLRRGRALSTAVVILSLLSLALPMSLAASSAGPAYVSYPRSASIPTATPEGGAVPDACASTVAPADWPVLLCDPFDNNPNGRWAAGIGSDQYAVTSRTVADGKYHWQQKALKAFASTVKYPDATLTDFFVAVDARLVEGPKTSQFGVSFRQVDGSNEYTFDINDQGQYRLDVLVKGSWTTLIDWTDNPAIQPGAINRIAAKGEGDQFTFYVNDQQVADFTDSQLTQGMVGISTDLDLGDQALFEFDNFEVRAPAGSAAITTATPSPTQPRRASPTPRTTSTPRARPTPTAAPTQAAGGTCDQDAAVAPQDWPLGICDTFDANRYGWATGDSSNDLGQGTLDLGQGVYHWSLKTTSGMFKSVVPTNLKPVSDFYLSAVGRRTAGPEDASWTLVFRRLDSDNLYTFNVSDKKNFAVYLLYRNQWQTLLDWTPSDAIKPGEDNLLAVKAVKSTLTFYINNQQVAEFNDARLSSGLPGLGVDLFANESVDVEFTSFELRASPYSTPVVTVPPGSATPEAATTPTLTATPTRRATPAPRASGTPTPRTPRGTPTATPAPTVSGSQTSLGCDADADIAPLDWLPVVCDTFDATNTKWTVGSDISDYAKINRTIRTGVYSWKLDGLKAGVFSAWYGTNRFSDVFVAVDARNVSGPTSMGYGLQFRKRDNDSFYDFKITDDGDYKIQVLVNSEWTTLTDWTSSDAIRPGAWNRLSIQAEGSTLTFWINGQQVAQQTDDHLVEGEAGLEVSLYDPVQATVEFNNFSVWTP